MSGKSFWMRLSCVLVITLVLSACQPAATPTPLPPTKAVPTETMAPIAVASPVPATPTISAEEEVSTGTLRMVLAHDPNSIDPHVHDGWYSVRFQSMCYEALVDMKWNPETGVLEMLPCLATSWDISDDGLTYRFKLREGVTFHDGHPFTSEAVKVTFERNAAMSMRASYQVKPIVELETPDDFTVVLHLEKRNSPFLMAMGRAYIMSPRAIEDHKTDDDPWAQQYFNEHMVGTGPYVCDSFVREVGAEFSKFTDYWRGWAGKHFDGINTKRVVERSTQLMLIEAGEADVADMVPLDDLPRLEANPDLVVHNNPSPMPFVWMFRPRGPLEDVRVRQALEHAVPHDDLIEETMSGCASHIYGPLTRAYPAYCEEGLIKYEYNLDRARALLEEAGWEQGFDLHFTTAASLPWEQDICVVLQGLWKKELNINLQCEAFASSAKHMSSAYTWEEPKVYDAFGMVLSAYLPDPDHQLWRWIGEDNIGGLNVSYYRNERVNEIFDVARQMPFGPERDALYCEASQIINHDAVHLWVLSKNDVRVFASDIQGFVYNPVDPIMEYRYYDMYRETGG